VEVAENRDEATVVNNLAGRAEDLSGAKFLKNVVHFGESQVGVKLLAAFAVGVELFTEEANALALGLGGIGKGEGLEAAGFIVAEIVSETESATRCKCPGDVNSAG
jgi:hypothetical protein